MCVCEHMNNSCRCQAVIEPPWDCLKCLMRIKIFFFINSLDMRSWQPHWISRNLSHVTAWYQPAYHTQIPQCLFIFKICENNYGIWQWLSEGEKWERHNEKVNLIKIERIFINFKIKFKSDIFHRTDNKFKSIDVMLFNCTADAF